MCVCVCVRVACVCVCLCTCAQAQASPGKRVRIQAKRGYITHILPNPIRTVLLPPSLCGSGIISFYKRFRPALEKAIKVETRRLWSKRTKHTALYLERMEIALNDKLFVRATYDAVNRVPVVIGWVIIHSIETQRLKDMTEESVAREGYPGKSVDWFLKKEFRGIDRETEVKVITFTLLSCAC